MANSKDQGAFQGSDGSSGDLNSAQSASAGKPRSRVRSFFIATLVALIVAAISFVTGLTVGAGPGANITQTERNMICSNLILTGYETEVHAKTSRIACEVVGMTEAAAVDYIESTGRALRVAYRDGEFFALTEDWSDSRINLWLLRGIVVKADAW